MRDFTLKKYNELCEFLISMEYSILPVREYLELQKNNNLPPKYVILRHDVDRWINKAINMAKNEHINKIKATYYFRYPGTFDIKSMQIISDLGHEIGYHYEVLSKNKGNESAAMRDFKKELATFQQNFQVKTICMHGNPLSRYNNRDIWKHNDYKNYGLIGEAYLSISNVDYFSDTGRTWSGTISKYDVMYEDTSNQSIQTTDDLMEFIERNLSSHLYITIHPERWASGIMHLLYSWSMDMCVNLGKKIILMR